MDEQPGFSVEIQPSGLCAEVPPNTPLTDALVQAGAILSLDCEISPPRTNRAT